jgi:cyclopropane fatty-acyl-phospholipid synthase-like methyltransferase
VASDERTVLLERVPRGATVLDVGCWAGAAGRFLIETRAATVDGVEPDAEMARRASEAYRRVVEGSIEDALASGGLATPEPYDAVLLLDVLEHLKDPWRVLREWSSGKIPTMSVGRPISLLKRSSGFVSRMKEPRCRPRPVSAPTL